MAESMQQESMQRSNDRSRPTLRWAIRSWWIGLLMLGILANVRPALAHGANWVLQQQAVALGECEVTLWTGPGILRPGEIHVIAWVVDDRQRPVWSNLVQVLVAPVGETAGGMVRTLAQPVAQADAQQMTHEAAFRLDAPGRYRVTVQLVDPSGRSHTTAFTLQVDPVPVWIQGGIYLLLLGALATCIWLLRLGKDVMQTGTF